MLCDRQLMRPAFTSDCVAKPSMRDDLEAYAKLCAVEYENEELGDLFTTVVVLGSLCALFGCFCTKKQRAWEKIEEEERRGARRQQQQQQQQQQFGLPAFFCFARAHA